MNEGYSEGVDRHRREGAYRDTVEDRRKGIASRSLWDRTERRAHTDHPARHWDCTCPACIPAMSPAAVDRVRELERVNMQREQTPIVTHHLIHAGLYARSITMPAGTVLTGALVTRSTVVIVQGDATVATGEDSARLTGYHVLPASAHRKQAFLAHEDTTITMLFATSAQTVEQCESEFTDEAELLFSRRGENVVTITGE